MSIPTFEDWIDTDTLEQDKLAEGTYYNLTKELEDLVLPEIPWDKLKIPDSLLDALQKEPKMPKIEDLTSRVPKGDGAFDALMESCSMHLKEEYERGRITGAEYTKAYIQLATISMQSAIQFVTSQDTIYWQSITAQLATLKASIEFYTLLVNYYISQVNLCLTKVQFASGKISLALSQKQITKTDKETDLIVEQIDKTEKETDLIIIQTDKTEKEIDLVVENTKKTKEETNLIVEQTEKVKEEKEQVRAQTADNRSDGGVVAGIIEKQKKLYDEQATAYKRNTEIKTVGVWMDGYSVNKTTDEGLLPPNNLTNSNVDEVMSELKSRVFDRD